jgi:exosortase family protein XrtM
MRVKRVTMTKWFWIKIFFRSNQKELKFVSLFILYFILGQVIYYSIRSHISPVIIHKMHVDLSSTIINAITPNEKTYSAGSKLIGAGGFQVSIATGCDGIDGILLLIAAICAFKMGLFRKFLGLTAGCLAIYFANIIRIIILYYTVKYKPGLFDVMHIYFGQIFIIFVGMLFFITWITVFGEVGESKG